MKVHEYALMRDVAAAQPRPRLPESLWAAPPLVVLNNFAGQEELKLATVLFQNLFPPINVQTTRLAQCQARAPPRPRRRCRSRPQAAQVANKIYCESWAHQGSPDSPAQHGLLTRRDCIAAQLSRSEARSCLWESGAEGCL